MSAHVEHETVLLDEAVAELITDPSGLYVDGTFGRGGHSSLILSRLENQGRLIAIDKDPEACAVAVERFGEDSRFEIVQASFADMNELVAKKANAGFCSGCIA